MDILSLRRFFPLLIGRKHQIIYVFLNILITAVSFYKSLIYLGFLSLNEVGYLTFILTIVQFVSFLQFGLLNGGYRLCSINSELDNQINNQLFSYFIGVFLLSIVGGCIYLFINKIGLEPVFYILGAILGVITLANNWLSNFLIAKSNLVLLNKVNLLSQFISLLLLLSVKWFGFFIVVSSLFIQQIIFTIGIFIVAKETIPNQFLFDKELLKKILFLGFVPFFMGICTQISMVFERFSIKIFLGTESLGAFYLPYVFNTLFLLLPAAISNLIFPAFIRNFENNDLKKFNKVMERYYYFIICYIVIFSLSTFLFLSFLVKLFFVKHLISIPYVYTILPGMALLLIVNPIQVRFYSAKEFKPLFFTYLSSMIFFSAAILGLKHFSIFTLQNVAIAHCLNDIYISVILFISYYYFKNRNNAITTKII